MSVHGRALRLGVRWATVVLAGLAVSGCLDLGPERATVPFSRWGGVTTGRTYSGLIELVISGHGDPNPAGRVFEDAFYSFLKGGCGCVDGRADPGLTISFSGCACVAECDGVPLSSLLTSYPRYSSDHVYTVTVDVGSVPVRLTFGHGACAVPGKTGSYVVVIREIR